MITSWSIQHKKCWSGHSSISSLSQSSYSFTHLFSTHCSSVELKQNLKFRYRWCLKYRCQQNSARKLSLSLITYQVCQELLKSYFLSFFLFYSSFVTIGMNTTVTVFALDISNACSPGQIFWCADSENRFCFAIFWESEMTQPSP